MVLRDRVKEKDERERCPVLIRAVKNPASSCSETIPVIDCICLSLHPQP